MLYFNFIWNKGVNEKWYPTALRGFNYSSKPNPDAGLAKLYL